jgi:signal peptidase I
MKVSLLGAGSQGGRRCELLRASCTWCAAEMSVSTVLAVLAGLLFPGFGQGLSRHRGRMLAWALMTLASLLLIVTSVWFVLVTLVVRAAGAIDAYLCLRTHAPPHHRLGGAIAVAIGAAGIIYLDVALEAYKIPSSSMFPTLVIDDHVYVDKLSLRWRPPERGEIVVFEHPCSRRVYIKRVIARGGDTVEVRCSAVHVNGSALPATLVDADVRYEDRDSDGSRVALTAARYGETHGARSYDTFHDVRRPTRGDHEPARGDFPPRDRPLLGCAQDSPVGALVETMPVDTAPTCATQLHYVVPEGTLFVMGDNRDNANDSRYWGVVRDDRVIGRLIGIWMAGDGGWARVGAVR